MSIALSNASPRRPRRASPLGVILVGAAMISLAGCSGGSASPRSTAHASSAVGPTEGPSAGSAMPASPGTAEGTVHLYTTVQQPTVDAVTAALADAHPGITLETFRAPTGEVAARIAAEERAGGIRADVLWLSDPLSIDAYARRDLLREWTPDGADAIDPEWTSETYWGTRILNVVIVAQPGLDPAPSGWEDLADPAHDAVAIPDPAFAGSAFGALGYFAQSPDYGFDFYRSIESTGGVLVNAPDEVTTGVAEGRFDVGMTLDFSVRQAAAKGSPVELVWPEEGSVAIYSPIGVVASSTNVTAAEAFVELILSRDGQTAIAEAGWEPVLDGVGGPEPEGEQQRPDWQAAFGRQQELIEEFASVFGD